MVALGFSARGADILASNAGMFLFHTRDAGVTILIKLVEMTAAAGNRAVELSYSDIGDRFGVSRTHVRKLLQDAERADLLQLSGQGERLVVLKPSMLGAFDRFVAEGMSGHDLLFGITLSKMAGAAD